MTELQGMNATVSKLWQPLLLIINYPLITLLISPCQFAVAFQLLARVVNDLQGDILGWERSWGGWMSHVRLC